MKPGFNPYRVSTLANIANECFHQIVGNKGIPGISVQEPRNPEEIEFVLNVIIELCHGYVELRQGRQTVDTRKGIGICPQCENEDIEADHRFCKICGLPLKGHG